MPERKFAPTIVIPAAREAEDILQYQDSVIGYETQEQAYQIRMVLLSRGIETEVFVNVGPPATATTPLEDRELRKLGYEPGTRHVLWGVRKVRPQV